MTDESMLMLVIAVLFMMTIGSPDLIDAWIVYLNR